MDPFGIDKDTLETNFKAWKIFLDIKFGKKNEVWTSIHVTDKIQKDGFSCGIIVCNFIKQIVENGFKPDYNHIEPFNLSKFRKEMAKTIIDSI